jgi:hypothetical protein
MAGLAGKNAGLRIAGTAYPVTNLNVNSSSELLDDSNSKSEGHNDRVAGFDDVEVSFDANFDESDVPIDSCTPGASVTLQVYISASNFIEIPVIISTFNFTAAIKGMVTYSCTGMGNGVDIATLLKTLN